MTSQEAADIELQKYRLDKIALARIAKIDAMFDDASARGVHWGSWMVGCANEREDLVNKLNQNGHAIPHRHLARCGGRRTD